MNTKHNFSQFLYYDMNYLACSNTVFRIQILLISENVLDNHSKFMHSHSTYTKTKSSYESLTKIKSARSFLRKIFQNPLTQYYHHNDTKPCKLISLPRLRQHKALL